MVLKHEMKQVERRFDVSVANSLLGPVEIATTVYFSENRPNLNERPIIVGAAGAGYSRGYFDMSFPMRNDYSEAAYHVDRGAIFIAVDLVGAGDSSIPDLNALDLPILARFHDEVARQIKEMATRGTLAPNLNSCSSPYLVGLGQSLGGAVTMVAQGRHATFDAVAILGFSAIEVVLPQPDGVAAMQGIKLGDYDFRYAFHWDDEPEDVILADVDGGHPLRKKVPPFGSATMPGCVMTINTPGIVAMEAAAISTPVFLANGERDMCSDPRAEASSYRNSPDVTTVIIPRMAHMHNFANTRHVLWRRLHDWISSVSGGSVE